MNEGATVAHSGSYDWLIPAIDVYGCLHIDGILSISVDSQDILEGK